MRKIELIPEIFYELPDEKVIETLFADKPKKEQYWQRVNDFPDFFYLYNPHLIGKEKIKINAKRTLISNNKLISLSVEDTVELKRLVVREKRRMTEGVYIMNNGEKIYFPGVYYGVLQWVKMFGVKGEGYGDHRKYQRYYSYIRDLAIKDNDLKGYYCHKAKKTGITQFESVCILIEAITIKQFTAAAMSKVLDTAKKGNFKYFLHGLKHLPHVLRPTIDQRGWQNAVQKIEFKTTRQELSMDSTYMAASTTIDGLDGLPIIQRVHIDEPPKFPKSVPIEQVYEKSKEQVNPQNIKRGIIAMTSYPPEEDTEAFFWCKKFYNEDCKIVDGRPLNGMIPFFIGIGESASDSFDKYGEPNIEANIAAELEARKLCKTPYELQSRKRQYPLSAKEGWEVGGGGSVYDNITLGTIFNRIEEEEYAGQLGYQEYNLEWTAGFLSPVRAVRVTMEEKLKGKSGLWRFYCEPQYLSDKTNLCFGMKRRTKYISGERHFLLQPPLHSEFVGATDPVDYAVVSQSGSNLSKTASITKTISGKLVSVYHNRAENPDVDIENIIMEMIYFNKYSLIEANRRNAYTTIDKLGLSYFLLVIHPNGEILPYSEKVSIKPVNSTSNIISEYVRLIIKRIQTNPEEYKDTRVIKQLMEFDAEDTQKYDLAVAEGLSEIAVKAMQSYITSKKSNVNKYSGISDCVAALI